MGYSRKKNIRHVRDRRLVNFLNLNGKNIQNIVTGLRTLSGIAISGNKLYWTEITGESSGKIRRANLNGSDSSTLAMLRSAPLDIAIDAVGKKLYWTDSDGNIRRANLKGKNIKKVVSGLTSPADLALGGLGTATAAPANISLASSEIQTPEQCEYVNLHVVSACNRTCPRAAVSRPSSGVSLTSCISCFRSVLGWCCCASEADCEIAGLWTCVKPIGAAHLIDAEYIVTPRSATQDTGLSCFWSLWV